MRGHVVDFLMLPNFPVFNVADICINIAAGLIILQALRGVNVDGSRHDDSDGRADGSEEVAAS
jgi:signal peptidase II